MTEIAKPNTVWMKPVIPKVRAKPSGWILSPL
jgi:hypothetical protein